LDEHETFRHRPDIRRVTSEIHDRRREDFDGAVGTGVFLVVGATSAGAPLGLPERIEALDAVVATIPSGRPGG
jgi:hypothetical protein